MSGVQIFPVIYPIHIVRAWRVFNEIEDGKPMTEAVRKVASIFKIKESTARTYVRSLISLDLVEKRDGNLYKKFSPKNYAEFRDQVVQKVWSKAGGLLEKAIEHLRRNGVSPSPAAISAVLSSWGYRVSEWRVRSAISMLTKAGLVMRSRTLHVQQPPKTEDYPTTVAIELMKAMGGKAVARRLATEMIKCGMTRDEVLRAINTLLVSGKMKNYDVPDAVYTACGRVLENKGLETLYKPVQVTRKELESYLGDLPDEIRRDIIQKLLDFGSRRPDIVLIVKKGTDFDVVFKKLWDEDHRFFLEV
ncbi:MAG: hypothetical protein ACTSXJ_06610 [Candidatus Baldrarchaeia archaeon]